MKSILITIAISVILSVGFSIGGIFLLKDNFIGPQGIQGLQGIQGIQGERGINGITTTKTILLSGKWTEYCIDSGIVAPAAFWCGNRLSLWTK